jgi:error-prone DNA polymerase
VRPGTKEKRLLARSGALNGLPEVAHRREALWQVELALHDDLLAPRQPARAAVLPPMDAGERLSADFSTQGATTGPHPMRLWREHHGSRQVLRATDLRNLPHGVPVTVAGMAICRQRPGTAKGHCFISLEDETGIANLFVPKKTFHQFRLVITSEPFLRAHGVLQRSEGDQPTVFVTHLEPLADIHREQAAKSHDFH